MYMYIPAFRKGLFIGQIMYMVYGGVQVRLGAQLL